MLPTMENPALIPHLFRTEFSRITAVLCRHLGLAHLQAAEDIAGETFAQALETWPYKGIPEQPVAWLYAVAKNKAKNYQRRRQVFDAKVAPVWQQSSFDTPLPEPDLSEQGIVDSQLQMLFAICQPTLPQEAQIGLALRILCGFGIDEIANAFLSNRETINKRLFRAREKLRRENARLELPPPEAIVVRLQTVLTTLYLLFNEGYYSESQDTILREDFCRDAMRLTQLLLDHERTAQPEVYALLALMCFHASRFPARKNNDGELVLYEDQDESLWDQDLILRGGYYLNCAARGDQLSKYHLEAAIAYWHTQKQDTPEKWDNILQLYNRLLMLEYSPIAALNRTFALAKVHGKPAAIAAVEQLALDNNPYYFTLLGELYTGIDAQKAQQHFEKALSLAKSPADKGSIARRLAT